MAGSVRTYYIYSREGEWAARGRTSFAKSWVEGGGGELNANVRSRIRVVVLSARGALPSGGDAFLFGDYFLSRFVFFTRLHPKLRNPNFYIHVTPPRAATAQFLRQNKKRKKRSVSLDIPADGESERREFSSFPLKRYGIWLSVALAMIKMRSSSVGGADGFYFLIVQIKIVECMRRERERNRLKLV